MTLSRILALTIATASLSMAIAVYCFARINSPEIFSPLRATSYYLATYDGVFGSAPSFFYTLAIGLVIGVCVSSKSSAKLHCPLWIALCVLLEISQHQAISANVSGWLSEFLFKSGWNLVGPYWMRGVFDPIDLIATLVGGWIALTLIARLPTEKSNADA